MRGVYLDAVATEAAIEEADPVVYEVYQYDVPFENGQLLAVTSVIHPGDVGGEYHMTKGHFHEKQDTAEIYLGLQDEGTCCWRRKTASSRPCPCSRAR